jgi:hypothetical protein
MSWSISTAGTKADVKMAIQKETHIPISAQAAFAAVVDALPIQEDTPLKMKTYGHIGETGGNVMFEIST